MNSHPAPPSPPTDVASLSDESGCLPEPLGDEGECVQSPQTHLIEDPVGTPHPQSLYSFIPFVSKQGEQEMRQNTEVKSKTMSPAFWEYR